MTISTGSRVLAGLLLPLTLLCGLSACGTDRAPEATDSRSPGATDSATPTNGEPVSVPEARQVAIITVTATGGGRVTPDAVRLDTPAAITAFAARFETPAMGNRIRAQARRATLQPGDVLVGAMVALGCGVPEDLVVESLGGRLQITAAPIENSPQECFAPMTSVGLVAVPAELAPAATNG